MMSRHPLDKKSNLHEEDNELTRILKELESQASNTSKVESFKPPILIKQSPKTSTLPEQYLINSTVMSLMINVLRPHTERIYNLFSIYGVHPDEVQNRKTEKTLLFFSWLILSRHSVEMDQFLKSQDTQTEIAEAALLHCRMLIWGETLEENREVDAIFDEFASLTSKGNAKVTDNEVTQSLANIIMKNLKITDPNFPKLLNHELNQIISGLKDNFVSALLQNCPNNISRISSDARSYKLFVWIGLFFIAATLILRLILIKK